LSEVRARTPKLVKGRANVRDVPLSPMDGFVLSRIDGLSNEQELIAVTGLSDEQVKASLVKLETFGVVTFDGTSSPDVAPLPPPPAPPASLVSTSAGDRTPPSSDWETTALAEDVDLDLETRRIILEVHSKLEQTDHYALLSVDASADKKTLRRAYFELASKFHPDRYFRKKLGSFQQRMEIIFGRLTLAHETLSHPDTRAEYDSYLEEQRSTRRIEQLLAEAIAEAQRAEELIEREVRAHTPLVAASSPAPEGPPPPAATAPPTAPPARLSPPPSIDINTRRDVLARRLRGSRPAASSEPPTRSSSPPQSGSATRMMPPNGPSVAEAMEALRRRYEERVRGAKAAQARKYMATGDAAVAKGDAVSAANAFRIAQSLSPDDPDLQRKARDTQDEADSVLSEMYARQGAYEEKTARWAEAARSWSRVCKARPNDASAHERAANALVKAGGELHDAGRLAERACILDPKNANYRVALANVYLAAGLALNARRELETAAQLAPQDGTIQAMIKRLGSKG
jgi:curved DNA-binding protein CbpA